MQRHHSLEPKEIVQSIYGLGKFHFNEDSGKALGLLAGEARRRIWDYSMDDLAQILASLCRAKISNQGFVTRLSERISSEELESCSTRSIVNLMTGLARSGVSSSRKKLDPWPALADVLSERLHADPGSLSMDDQLGALTAYAFPHVNHAHVDLFSSVSQKILSHALSRQQVLKYLKACARGQFRDIPALSHCAKCLRSDGDFPAAFSTAELLEVFSTLGKLGADLPELTVELSARGVALPAVSTVTWFRQSPRVSKSHQS